jgi:uncharacterized protein YkwD
MLEEAGKAMLRARRWRLLRMTLVVLGLGLVLGGSLYLLSSDASTPSVGAQTFGTTEPIGYQAFEPDYEPAPYRPSPSPTLDEELYKAQLVWIHAALQPTATATPVPPTATPAPYVPPAEPYVPPPAAPAEPEVVAPPPASCPTSGIGGYALALFNAINDARVQNGMWTLAPDYCVAYVAQVRSNDMAARGYFAHESPDGSSAFSLLDAYGVPHGWAGENLARNNYPDAETVAVAIRDLMASPPHRANILSANYTALGVAVADDGAGMRYYTMVFIGPP